LWGDVGRSQILTTSYSETHRNSQVGGRERWNFPHLPTKTRGEIWGTRIGGMERV
jgi:hypothetical protein